MKKRRKIEIKGKSNEKRTIINIRLFVIVISKLLKRHSKAKRKAPAYSRALRQIRGVFPKNSPWEAQIRLPEGERMRPVRGVAQVGCQRVRGGRYYRR